MAQKPPIFAEVLSGEALATVDKVKLVKSDAMAGTAVSARIAAPIKIFFILLPPARQPQLRRFPALWRDPPCAAPGHPCRPLPPASRAARPRLHLHRRPVSRCPRHWRSGGAPHWRLRPASAA